MDYIKWIRSKVGHEKVFLNFASGILYKSNKILLQKRGDKGTWGLPGGAIELGESASEALIREFLEETGLEVHPVRLQNVYSKYEDSYPNGDVAQTVTIAYLVDAKDTGSIEGFKNSETKELKFFSREEIKDLKIVNKQHEDMINEFFSDKQDINR